MITLCAKFERNLAICGDRVTAISVFCLMTLNIALRVALGSLIIFTKFDLRQLIRVLINYSVFYADTLRQAVTDLLPVVLKIFVYLLDT